MQLNFKGTDLQITDELRDYCEKRLAHAAKFLSGDSTALCDIELQHVEHSEQGRFRAELTCSCGSQVYRAEAWGSSMHEAIDLASAELTGELQRIKQKKIKVLRHSAVKVKEFLRGWRRKI